jgi:hypothetical protein
VILHFRPAKDDAVVYCPWRDELRVHAAKADRRLGLPADADRVHDLPQSRRVPSSGDPPAQAEVQALRDKAEELADDVRALSTLVHALRGALVAVGVVKGGA